MNIYIDFDDCLCETAARFSTLVEEMFHKNVPYEEIFDFNLQKSFGLNDEDYDRLMTEGHVPEVLLSYAEAEGASETINSWIAAGHKVSIVTGRPYSAYTPSRQWLDEHDLSGVELICVNKYGRENFMKGSSFSLSLEEYRQLHFDFAVEDSPAAFKHLAHLPECTVAVYSRPWNKEAQLPSDRYRRCSGWKEIDRLLQTFLPRQEVSANATEPT